MANKKMQIKIIEDPFFKDKGDIFYENDLRTVSCEDGEYYCKSGWAEDVAGKVPTGERKINEPRLDIRNSNNRQNTEEVG